MSDHNYEIGDLIKLLKKPKPWYSYLREWISTILLVITIVMLITEPFSTQQSDISKIRSDVLTIKYVLWKYIPESRDLINNPYNNTRSGSPIGLAPLPPYYPMLSITPSYEQHYISVY